MNLTRKTLALILVCTMLLSITPAFSLTVSAAATTSSYKSGRFVFDSQAAIDNAATQGFVTYTNMRTEYDPAENAMKMTALGSDPQISFDPTKIGATSNYANTPFIGVNFRCAGDTVNDLYVFGAKDGAITFYRVNSANEGGKVYKTVLYNLCNAALVSGTQDGRRSLWLEQNVSGIRYDPTTTKDQILYIDSIFFCNSEAELREACSERLLERTNSAAQLNTKAYGKIASFTRSGSDDPSHIAAYTASTAGADIYAAFDLCFPVAGNLTKIQMGIESVNPTTGAVSPASFSITQKRDNSIESLISVSGGSSVNVTSNWKYDGTTYGCNCWHHVEFEILGGVASIYIDGTKTNTRNDGTFRSTYDLSLGCPYTLISVTGDSGNGAAYIDNIQFAAKRGDMPFYVNNFESNTLNPAVGAQHSVYYQNGDTSKISVITLYAIRYQLNGGTGNINPDYRASNTATTITTKKPTRSGYTFNGWNTSSDGKGTAYASGSTYTRNTQLEDNLYAMWTANKYTINFDANGGNCDVKSKQVTFDSPIGEMPSPTLVKKNFEGWFTSRTGGNKITSDVLYQTVDNITLFAQYTDCVHEYRSEVITPATCTVNGLQKYICTKCAYSYEAPITASHKLVFVPAQEVTCTKDGYNQHLMCTVCGEKIGYVETAKAAGHDFTKVTTAASSTRHGSEKYTCSKCGETFEINTAKPTNASVIWADCKVSGTQLTANIYIEKNPGVNTLVLYMGYNADALTPNSITNGNVFTTANNGEMLEARKDIAPLILYFDTDELGNISESGLLATVTFDIISEKDSFLVTLSLDEDNTFAATPSYDLYLPDISEVYVDCIPGLYFTESDEPLKPGDIDLDGKITFKDANLIKSIVLSRMAPTENADLNNDGKVTTTDVNLLKQLLLGSQ